MAASVMPSTNWLWVKMVWLAFALWGVMTSPAIGLGKTHLSIGLEHAARLNHTRMPVTTAVEIQHAGRRPVCRPAQNANLPQARPSTA
jgi:hypothetical protein